MSEQKVKWSDHRIGGLWVKKDDDGTVKNFSGFIKVNGEDRRVLVMKRKKWPEDDPDKNYPNLEVYDMTSMDEAKEGGSVKTPAKKSKPAAQKQEDSIEDELI